MNAQKQNIMTNETDSQCGGSTDIVDLLRLA